LKDRVHIVQATPSDAASVAACLTEAFAADPLMTYFFGDNPAGRDPSVTRFFSLLLRVRIAMRMPALLAREGDRLVGGAMGYTTERPDWPTAFEREWEAFESTAPQISERFSAYQSIADAALPPEPHYYLGVIGVAPQTRGTGAGGALLRAFCQLSADDPLSSGVYLETANPANLGFYARHGFVSRGSGPLGRGSLWCLFHAHERRAAERSSPP
jgi:GNAT superfamily N-acetyltransferase